MYLCNQLFFVECEDRSDAFVRIVPIGEKSAAFIVMCNDAAAIETISEKARVVFQKKRSLSALFSELTGIIDWSGKKAQFVLLDMDAGDLQCYTIQAPLILSRTDDGRINKLGKIDLDFGGTTVEIHGNGTHKISTLLLTLDTKFAAQVENHIPFCYSRREIKNAIKNFTKKKSAAFCFINCEIGRNKLVSRSRAIGSNLAEMKIVENDLETLLRECIPHDDLAATNIMLSFNEIIMNAFEHGSLKLDRDHKQDMIAHGVYEEFMASHSSDLKIHITFDYYTNGFIKIAITDEGAGFDYIGAMKDISEARSLDVFCGRGLKMADQVCAALFFSNGGRTTTFFTRTSLVIDQVPSEEAMLRAVNVLYADDDEYILLSVERLLKRAVHTLLLAKDGVEAFKLFEMYKPDIVVTDIEMPIMGGLELAEKIRAIDKFVPIIATTAYGDEKFFVRATEIGIDKALTKPIRFPIVHAALVRFAYGCYIREQKPIVESLRPYLTKELRAALIRDDSPSIGGVQIETNVRANNLYGVIKIDEARTFIYLWNSPYSIVGATGAALLGAIADRLRTGEGLREIVDIFYAKTLSIGRVVCEVSFAFVNSATGEIDIIGAYESEVRKINAQSFAFGDEIVIKF